MEAPGLNIDDKLRLGFIFGGIGLFSISWYAPISGIFGWEEFPFILIAGLLWFFIFLFQLLFLFNANEFQKSPTMTRLKTLQLFLVLSATVFLAEILYFSFRGFWITDTVANIGVTFLIYNCITIFREIQRTTLINGEPLKSTGESYL